MRRAARSARPKPRATLCVPSPRLAPLVAPASPASRELGEPAFWVLDQRLIKQACLEAQPPDALWQVAGASRHAGLRTLRGTPKRHRAEWLNAFRSHSPAHACDGAAPLPGAQRLADPELNHLA
eukprot:6452128-Alexandrium_andersonii.AAC.1